MFVTFRDSLGSICVRVDKYGISFDSSRAFFSSEDEVTGEVVGYRVTIDDLISITEER